LPSQDPGTQRIGYEDFPGPNEFQSLPLEAASPSFPASIPC